LQRRSWDAVRLTGLSLARKSTSVKIADSTLYFVVVSSHREVEVVVLFRVKKTGVFFGWVAEK
jgi:hypothetical protein